jgi:hypothetical protein
MLKINVKIDQTVEVSETEISLMIQDAVERGVTKALSLHPRPSSVNLICAAEMLDISRRTVSTMVRDGRIRTNILGRIPITEIDKVLAASDPESRGSNRRLPPRG